DRRGLLRGRARRRAIAIFPAYASFLALKPAPPPRRNEETSHERGADAADEPSRAPDPGRSAPAWLRERRGSAGVAGRRSQLRRDPGAAAGHGGEGAGHAQRERSHLRLPARGLGARRATHRAPPRGLDLLRRIGRRSRRRPARSARHRARPRGAPPAGAQDRLRSTGRTVMAMALDLRSLAQVTDPGFAALTQWTVRSGAVLAIAAITAFALRRRSAALRHAVWRAALAAVLLIPALAAIAPRWELAWLPATRTAATATTTQAPVQANARAAEAVPARPATSSS